MKQDDRMQILVSYLEKNLSKGYDLDTLKWALINQGKSRALVERAIERLGNISKESSEINSVPKEKPKIKYELYGENNKPIRKPLWKRISEFFKG